ncbi:MAG TPA: DMT family transporter [Methylomirabilota bacterium]|nr:DMT family transporter [Methylomirabilota bacterium]
MTWPALLALLAAFAFGIAGVLLKRGLQYATPLTAALVSVTFTTGLVWLLAALTTELSLLMTGTILPFLIAGLVAPGLARLALFVGVDRIGVSRAAPLVATAPLFSVAMAILFLGERPSWMLLVGAACIVTGGVLLSQRGLTDRAWRRRDLVFPLLAALGFAFRDNISRYGFREYSDPLLAAAAATLTSLAVMWLFAGLQAGSGRMRLQWIGLGFLALSGLSEGLAYMTMWRALALGDVSVVSPLINAQSIFAVALAAVFLRDLERVTWRIAVAAGLIVAGVAAVVRFATG